MNPRISAEISFRGIGPVNGCSACSEFVPIDNELECTTISAACWWVRQELNLWRLLCEFNFDENKYRLVAHVSYLTKRVLIKFIGTHREYDRIDPELV